jgi:hypothetical protein
LTAHGAHARRRNAWVWFKIERAAYRLLLTPNRNPWLTLLLEHMSQLVRQQGLVGLAGPEYHVMADGVRVRINRLGGFGGKSIGMDSHPAEIVAEPWLKEGAQRTIEGPAR